MISTVGFLVRQSFAYVPFSNIFSTRQLRNRDASLRSIASYKIDGMSSLLKLMNPRFFPLLSKCLKLQRLCSKNTSSSQPQIIELSDFPGGVKAFELCATFCYGITITLSANNIVSARCAAKYLQMTEDVEKGNLVHKLEVFFNSCILSGWKDCIVTLQTTKPFQLWSEELGITSRCIDSLVSKVVSNPMKVISDNRSNQKGDIEEVCTAKRWWGDSLSELRIDLYWRLQGCKRTERSANSS
ncbi:putative chromatin remodeling & transcription regulator BTB-POZ family [Helianthus annuus]|nr:putative chromatin remodeling & transcription regulator BTB-POZ family [Helianthus annuus]